MSSSQNDIDHFGRRFVFWRFYGCGTAHTARHWHTGHLKTRVYVNVNGMHKNCDNDVKQGLHFI